MEKLLILLLFCHITSAVKHSVSFYATISSGHPNIPDYMVAADVDEVEMAYYDSSMEKVEPRQDWVRKFIENDQEDWGTLTGGAQNYGQMFRVDTEGFKQQSNQTEGLHIIRQHWGCEWDNETEKVDGFLKYGYNGDDFLTLDLQTLTWSAAKPQAETIKQEWDGDKAKIQLWRNSIDNIFPSMLRKFSNYASGFLQRTEKSSDSTIAAVVAVVVLVVVLICSVAGFIVYKKKTAELPAPPPGDSELTENLNPT
ncbi:hypothetical protein INR49_017725 [Caranx melampygus]|nr:hypothetical protein INR49_017725 [Caranx melampygus]